VSEESARAPGNGVNARADIQWDEVFGWVPIMQVEVDEVCGRGEDEESHLLTGGDFAVAAYEVWWGVGGEVKQGGSPLLCGVSEEPDP